MPDATGDNVPYAGECEELCDMEYLERYNTWRSLEENL